MPWFLTILLSLPILVFVIYVASKIWSGYYRFDIPLETAFSKEELSVFTKHKRFIIVGSSCSGKSTLAKQLCSKYNDLKRIELDYLSWLPQWKCRPKQEFRSLVSNTISQANKSGYGWIIDGNYKNSRDIMWSKVQVVIWLEYEFWNVFYRACKRTLLRIIYKESVCNGNIETFWGFISDPMQGIPFWVWKCHRKFKQRIPKWKEEYPHVILIKIESPYHCKYWLDNLSQ